MMTKMALFSFLLFPALTVCGQTSFCDPLSSGYTKDLCDITRNFEYSVQMGANNSKIAYSQSGISSVTPPQNNSAHPLFSGNIPISINLFNVTARNINFPVSLSYSANSVKPDNKPSWTGLGWFLNAGGAIRRRVNGMPDDHANLVSGEYIGYYYYKTNLGTADWSSDAKLKQFTNDKYDYEPDEFNFSMPGYSGNFFIDVNGDCKVKSNQSIKIILKGFIKPFIEQSPRVARLINNGNGYEVRTFEYPRVFSGFTVITPDGYKYEFGGSANSINFSMVFNNQNNDVWRADTWFLTKIISPEGSEAAAFFYERGEYDSMLNCFHNSFTEMKYILSTSGNGLNSTETVISGNGYSGRKLYTGLLMAPVYLKQIETATERLVFSSSIADQLKYEARIYDTLRKYGIFSSYNNEYSSTYLFPFLSDNMEQINPFGTIEADYPQKVQKLKSRKLDEIRLESKVNGKIIGRYQFTYNVFNDKRLKLKSVRQLSGSASESLPPYEFKYKDNILLPDYFSAKTDHWGFFKGSETPDPAPSNFSNYYDYRQPNATYILAETLEEVKTPKGLVTKYTFEPNRYTTFVEKDRTFAGNGVGSEGDIGGGVRIKRIDYFDTQINSSTYREYKYNVLSTAQGTGTVNWGIGSGTLFGKPVYYWPQHQTSFTNTSDGYVRFERFTADGLGPLESNDTYVGYSDVAEINPSGGFTLFKFSSFFGNPDEVAVNQLRDMHFFHEKYSELALERGNLTEERVYNSDSKLLQSKVINYKRILKENYRIKTVAKTKVKIWANQYETNFYECSANFKYYHAFLPQSVTETSYDENGGNPLISVTDFKYHETNDAATDWGKYNQVTETKTTDSKGSVFAVSNFYPHFLTNNKQCIDVCWEQYLFNTKEAFRSKGPSGENFSSPESCISYYLGQYENCKNNCGDLDNPYAMMYKRNIFAQPISTIKHNAENNNVYYVTDGTLTKYKLGPGNKIERDADLSFQTSTPVQNFMSTVFVNGSLNYDSRFRQVMAYQRIDNNNNPIEEKPLTTGVNSRLVDPNTNLIVAQALNAGYNDIAYTGFETDYNGRWSYSQSGVIEDVTAVTGKKCFRLDNGAQSLTVSVTGLSPQVKYVVTYWLKDGSGNCTVNFLPGTVLLSKNGWKLYRHIAQSANSLMLTGTGKIDEVRLHPFDARMTSMTYEPSVGLSSICSPGHEYIYNEYDAFNRIRTVRDRDKNIIKVNKYYEQAYTHTNAVWSETGMSNCQLGVNGLPTGALDIEEKDINVNSSSYNTLRWVTKFDLNKCPPNVYAKLELRNLYTNTNGYQTTTSGDVVIKFVNGFGNPVSINGLNLNMRLTTTDCQGYSNCNDDISDFNVYASGTEHLIYSGDIFSEYDYYGALQSISKQYSILPGTGYIIL